MQVGFRIPRPRRGHAGLLLVLFVVAGLVFSYGLGRGTPLLRVCTAHDVSVPAAATAGGGGGVLPVTAAVHGGFETPPSPVPVSPADACLCLAVIIGLMVLALAARPRRVGRVRPARSAWPLAPPASRLPASLSLSRLQVLRL